MTPLYKHSLTELRQKLASGETTPTEAVAASLDRIKATEPQINACITVCAEKALAEAAALENSPNAAKDRADTAGKPLWGVPLTLKDVICAKGVPMTCASHTLSGFIPPYDATVAVLLREAGGIVTAKTNLDEFAMGSSTESSAFGPSKNPWDTSRVPGGSSGGSAASLAACQAFGSLGSDTGGSIRQPAGLCGCVGLKPTYGRVSRYGAAAYASSFDQVGPMARNVQDCAVLFGVIAGYDPKDPTSSQLPAPDLNGVCSGKDLQGLVLGLPEEYWLAESGASNLSPEVENACRAAVQTARELGATIKKVSLPYLLHGVAAYYILASAEASTNLARFDGMRYGLRRGDEKNLISTYVDSRSQGFGEEVKRRILLGTYVLSAGYYDAYYTKAAKVRRLIQEDYRRALLDCDALLAPACPTTAWKPGAFAGNVLAAYKMDILTLGLNLAGLPGLSLPVGLGAESGMPVGLQIMGRPFDEAKILSIGHVLEQAVHAPACDF